MLLLIVFHERWPHFSQKITGKCGLFFYWKRNITGEGTRNGERCNYIKRYDSLGIKVPQLLRWARDLLYLPVGLSHLTFKFRHKLKSPKASKPRPCIALKSQKNKTPHYLTAELTNLLSIKVGGVVFYRGHLSISLDFCLALFYRLKPNNWLAPCEQSDRKL